MREPTVGRVALVWRGDPKDEPPTPSATRFHLIFSALSARGLAAEPVLYCEEMEDQIRKRLLAFDGVLVWVNRSTQAKIALVSTRAAPKVAEATLASERAH